MRKEEIRELKNRYVDYLVGLNDQHHNRPIELSGFYSSLRKNPLFLNNEDHRDITNFLLSRLNEISEKYKYEQKLEQYITDTSFLICEMERMYSNRFIDGKFKLSHSQKTLSVYLKYRWCCGTNYTPPACPIDRNVLCRLGWPSCKIRWTKITEPQYNDVLSQLSKRAEGEHTTIAEMELRWFDEMVITN